MALGEAGSSTADFLRLTARRDPARKGRTDEVDIDHLCFQPYPDPGLADGGAGRRPGGRPGPGGADEGTPVTEAYKVPFKFTGEIAKVTIELKEMKTADHDEAEQARKIARLKKALSDLRVSWFVVALAGHAGCY